MAFRQAVLVRFALAEGVILLGLPLAMVGHSELVFAAAFVLGYPLLVWLVLPTRGGVERMRRRLEERGAESHLWAVLLAAPAPAGRRRPRPGGGPRRGRLGPAAQSQPLLRSRRNSSTQMTAITPMTSGYPKLQCSSGMWSKFIP